MRKKYQRWIYNWEARLTSRDTNRIVRPLEWGTEWAERWPLVRDIQPPQDTTDTAAMIAYWTAVNQRIIDNSDDFYSYETPSDFRLENRKVELFHTGSAPPKTKLKDHCADFLRFTSPVETPYPENNVMNARWFPAEGERAVVVIPQWNADGVSQNGLCRIFNKLGIAALRMSMPYHDIRRPAELTASRLRRLGEYRTYNSRRAAGHCRYPLVHGLAAATGLQQARHRRHQPGLVLRIHRGCTRSADIG